MKIQDEVLAPFSIDHNSDNYDVIEDTGRVDKKEKPILKTHGHFSSVEHALLKIAKLKVEQVDAVYTIKEYVAKLREIKSNFNI